jgi:putative ABC transport system substrate-binding protein
MTILAQRARLSLSHAAFLLAVSLFFASDCDSWAHTSDFRIGVLTPGLTFKPVVKGLVQGLGNLGFREGINVKFLVEDSKGDLPGLASRAAKLIAAKPDVLFTVATAPTLAAKQATQTIPIVFAGVVDPIQSGMIASFASSRNNLTGVTAYTAYLSGKRLEVLKEIAPQTRNMLAIVSGREVVAQISLKQLEEVSSRVNLHIVRHDVASEQDIEKLLLNPWAGKVDAIFHLPSIFVEKYMDRIIAKSLKEKLPLIVHEGTLLEKGALASYGGDFRLYGVQAAKLVAKVFKGAKPSQIPTETPDQLVLTINLATARTIGLTIPRKILERADRLLD